MLDNFEKRNSHLHTFLADRKFEKCLAAAKAICEDPDTPRYWFTQAAIIASYATDDLDEACNWIKLAATHLEEWHERGRAHTRKENKEIADFFDDIWGQLADAVTAVIKDFYSEEQADEIHRDLETLKEDLGNSLFEEAMELLSARWRL